MRLEFASSDRSGRFAVKWDGKIIFESYHLEALERRQLQLLIECINDSAYAEGLKCQRELASIDATSSSRASTGAAAPPPSASTPPGNHCVLAENLSIAPAGVASDERK